MTHMIQPLLEQQATREDIETYFHQQHITFTKESLDRDIQNTRSRMSVERKKKKH